MDDKNEDCNNVGSNNKGKMNRNGNNVGGRIMDNDDKKTGGRNKVSKYDGNQKE